MTGELHLWRGTGRHYRVRYRGRGARKWTVGGGRYRTFSGAAKALAGRMADQGYLKVGEVLFCADYYDAVPSLVMSRP